MLWCGPLLSEIFNLFILNCGPTYFFLHTVQFALSSRLGG